MRPSPNHSNEHTVARFYQNNGHISKKNRHFLFVDYLPGVVVACVNGYGFNFASHGSVPDTMATAIPLG